MSKLERSVNVMITLYLHSFGSRPMKSIVTESYHWSETGSGCSGPVGHIVCGLLCWHPEQPRM